MRSSRPLRATLVVWASVVALLVAGCGGDDETGGARTLSWYVFAEPSGAFAEAADRCSQQSDGRYRIEFQFLPSQADGQREQLVRRLAAEDDDIDIMGLDVIWTPEFANAGWLAEWTGERREKVTEGVFDSVLETATFEDKLWAAPFTSNTQLLWYRKDLVDEVPETWDEMIDMAEELPRGENRIQVQANRYEGLVVWTVAMIASAGAQVLEDPETVGLAEEPTKTALATMGRLANSPVADPAISTSNEDSGRLAFEAGTSAFMVNYPFVFPSAKENAPEIFEQMASAKYPKVVRGEESAPPLGGINLGISAYSTKKDLAFEAVECLVQPENQIVAAQKGGLPPTQASLYDTKEIREAYPGFADLMRESIRDATPRPSAVAYQDLSLAIQRAIHPVDEISPRDPDETYQELREKVEQAVAVEGLL